MHIPLIFENVHFNTVTRLLCPEGAARLYPFQYPSIIRALSPLSAYHSWETHSNARTNLSRGPSAGNQDQYSSCKYTRAQHSIKHSSFYYSRFSCENYLESSVAISMQATVHIHRECVEIWYSVWSGSST